MHILEDHILRTTPIVGCSDDESQISESRQNESQINESRQNESQQNESRQNESRQNESQRSEPPITDVIFETRRRMRWVV